MTQHKPKVTRLQSRTSAAALSEFPEDMNGEEWVEGDEGEEGWEDEDEMSPPRATSPTGSAFGRGFRKVSPSTFHYEWPEEADIHGETKSPWFKARTTLDNS